MSAQQKPIHSGFGPHSTAAEIAANIDLTGKTAIVTGGASGIGFETSRVLKQAGATVIVAARDLEKARLQLASLGEVEVEALDLIDPTSIDTFAQRFVMSGRPLDLLINNAGVMAAPLTFDSRGYELHFSANHLGHFHLTLRLWPALMKAGRARVVTLSSGAHRQSPVYFDDLDFRHREYDKWKAYAQSKTANVLFTVALDRIGEPHGIRAFAVHPGRIETNLQRYISMQELQARGFRDNRGEIPPDQRRLYKTPEQGAATSIWCAVSPQLDHIGGVYCENADVAEAVPADHTALDGVLPWAIDSEAAELLWDVSERMTEVEGPRTALSP